MVYGVPDFQEIGLDYADTYSDNNNHNQYEKERKKTIKLSPIEF